MTTREQIEERVRDRFDGLITEEDVHETVEEEFEQRIDEAVDEELELVTDA
jgi:hypothetical protein